MLPFVFPSMAALRAVAAHYGWHVSSDGDILDSRGRMQGTIVAKGKRQVRVAWFN